METHNEIIAALIRERRQALGLTQKDIADHLGITDKAVSKWERAVSCPDISLLVPLADLLGVSVGELLAGKKTEVSEKSQEVNQMVDEVVRYSSRNTSQKLDAWRRQIFFGLSAALLIATAICFICDYFTAGTLSWSLLVAACVLTAWIVLMPALLAKQKIIRKTLLAVTVTIVPFLAVLRYLLCVPLVLSLGSSIAVVSLAALWSVYGIFFRLRARRWSALGFSFLLTIPVSFAINGLVMLFLHEQASQVSNFFNTAIALLCSLLCFSLDHAHAQKAAAMDRQGLL